MKKPNSKILPLTLSTTLTLFSFSALPAAANTDEQTNAPVNVLNETEVATTQNAESQTVESSAQSEASVDSVTETKEQETGTDTVTTDQAVQTETSEESTSTTEATVEPAPEETSAEQSSQADINHKTTTSAAEPKEESAPPAEETAASQEGTSDNETTKEANETSAINSGDTTANETETVEVTTETDSDSLELVEGILTGGVSVAALVLSDGSRVELDLENDGTWTCLSTDMLDSVAGLEVEAAGETHTFLYAELLEEISAYVAAWIDTNVTIAEEGGSANLLTGVKVVLPGDITVQEAKLHLDDGTSVELDPNADFAFLGESKVAADSVMELSLVVDGEEYTIDLSGVTAGNGVLTIPVAEADLGLDMNLVNHVNLTLPEGLEAENVKLVLGDGTLVDLEASDDSYVLLTEDDVSLDEITQLWLVIDGEEFTIDLDELQLENDLLTISLEAIDLDLDVDLVTEISLTLPGEVEAEELKLVLADGTLVELEATEDSYVLLTEDEVSLGEIAQLWLMIDGEEFTIDLDELQLENGLLDIVVDEEDLYLDLTAVTEINLTLPDDIEIDDAELVLVDGTVVELDITDDLTFLIDGELYLEDIAYLAVAVDGTEYTVDLTEADLEEGVLAVTLGLDVFFDAVTELDLNLPEGLDIEGATLQLTDGTLLDLEVTEDLVFLLGDNECYLQNVAALWLMIDGEEIEIDLTDWDYEVSGEGLLSITLPEDFLDSLHDNDETEVEFLTGLTINLLNFTGDIDSAVLIYGDNDRLDLDIVDGSLVLNLEDLELELEDLLGLEIVIDGETYSIDFDEDSLTEVDGEVTFDIDFDVDIDVGTDSNSDSDTDNDSDTGEAVAGTDTDENAKKSGMLPYTGESSNMLFYLTGLLISALGVLNLRKRKLNKE